MKNLANHHAHQDIRVNTIHPTGVATPMVLNDSLARMHASLPEHTQAVSHLLPIDMLQAGDVSNTVAWLCSDQARYITGVAMPVDAGYQARA